MKTLTMLMLALVTLTATAQTPRTSLCYNVITKQWGVFKFQMEDREYITNPQEFKTQLFLGTKGEAKRFLARLREDDRQRQKLLDAQFAREEALKEFDRKKTAAAVPSLFNATTEDTLAAMDAITRHFAIFSAWKEIK